MLSIQENVIKELLQRYNREQMLDLRSRKNGEGKLNQLKYYYMLRFIRKKFR